MMRRQHLSDLLFTAALLGLALLGTGAGAALLVPGSTAPGPPAPALLLEHRVGLAAAVAGLLLGLWWVLAGTAALLGALTASRRAPAWVHGYARVAPPFMRRLAAALLGSQLLLAPGALAGGPAPAPPAALLLLPTDGDAIDPAWTPTPPPTEPGVVVPAPSRPAPPDVPDPTGEVVVHRGDTLWSIAATALGPYATDVEIARAWPRWYRANRALIGADPHLILPGQRLLPPESAPAPPEGSP